MFLCRVSRRRSRKRFFEPDLFRIVGLAEHRQRQLGGLRQHLDGRAPGPRSRRWAGLAFTVSARAGHHLAVDADHALGAQALDGGEARRVRADSTSWVRP